MRRDVGKAKNVGTEEKRLTDKTEGASLETKHEGKENKRGWRDVFDNLEYSDGPGDNIYVFG